MKKISMILMAFVAIVMTSCDKDPVDTRSYPVPTYNLITYADTTQQAEVVKSVYRYQMDMIKHTISVVTEFTAPSQVSFGFSTDNLPFTSANYAFNGYPYEVLSFSADKVSGEIGKYGSVNNLKCILTNMVYTPQTADGGVQDYVNAPEYMYTFMQYKVGTDVTVRTFWNDVTFRGKTATDTYTGGIDDDILSRPGTPVTSIAYRLVIDFKDPKDPRATIIMYNAKFTNNEREPVKSQIQLKDLPVKFNNNGYRIDAQNVIPELYESGKMVPYPNYAFDTVRFVVGGDLTECLFDFVVAGKYRGQFAGSYLVKKAEDSSAQ